MSFHFRMKNESSFKPKVWIGLTGLNDQISLVVKQEGLDHRIFTKYWPTHNHLFLLFHKPVKHKSLVLYDMRVSLERQYFCEEIATSILSTNVAMKCSAILLCIKFWNFAMKNSSLLFASWIFWFAWKSIQSIIKLDVMKLPGFNRIFSYS